MPRKSVVKKRESYYAKVIKGQLKCDFIYEDDLCMVADEVFRQAPIHFIVLPKRFITHIDNSSEDDVKLVSHMLEIAKNMAIDKGLQNAGYHVMYTEDFQPEKTDPFTIHVFGRALHHMKWPVTPSSCTRL